MQLMWYMFWLLYSCVVYGGFKSDAIVLTPYGIKNISSLHVGDTVLTFDIKQKRLSLSPITHLHYQKKAYFDKIKFLNGVTIIVAHNQKFAAMNKHGELGWFKTKQLKPNMIVLAANQSPMVVDLVERNVACDDVYDIRVEETHAFFVTDHYFVVHNFITVGIGIVLAFNTFADISIASISAIVSLFPCLFLGYQLSRSGKKSTHTLASVAGCVEYGSDNASFQDWHVSVVPSAFSTVPHQITNSNQDRMLALSCCVAQEINTRLPAPQVKKEPTVEQAKQPVADETMVAQQLPVLQETIIEIVSDQKGMDVVPVVTSLEKNLIDIDAADSTCFAKNRETKKPKQQNKDSNSGGGGGKDPKGPAALTTFTAASKMNQKRKGTGHTAGHKQTAKTIKHTLHPTQHQRDKLCNPNCDMPKIQNGRFYLPSKKHMIKGNKFVSECITDLKDGQNLLSSLPKIKGTKNLYGTYKGQLVEFKPTRTHPDGVIEYHSFYKKLEELKDPLRQRLQIAGILTKTVKIPKL